jgi:molybdopterin/thiamine biosynthesis adenylyltransferase
VTADGLRFSRARATATDLAAAADPYSFIEKSVLLTGTVEALSEANGAEMAHCALLLLMRTTKAVSVGLPAACVTLAQDLERWAAHHAWSEMPRFLFLPVDLAEYDAILSIGGAPRPELPWTAITSEGWLARVTSGSTSIAQGCGRPNPIGALAATSLGVAEIFKRVLPVHPDKAELLDGCVFSLWSYRVHHTDPGPVLQTELDVDLLVAGGGAIGNGIAHLLSRLPLRGRAAVVDNQTYGEENWGTCLRLTREAATRPKAPFIADLLRPRLKATPVQGRIEEVGARTDWRMPRVVLSGFDNVDARYAVQDLWPDLIIDGAIGPKLECQVSAHPWGTPVACLRCIFEQPPGERAEIVQRRISGLTLETLSDQSRALTDSDVAAAVPEKQNWLRTQLGKPICSILTVAHELAGAGLLPGFRPSVPFVATMSACLMATELVRYLTTKRVGVEPRFFFSLLWGPGRGDFYPEDRRADCVCVIRAKNIERIRASRSTG